MTIKKVSIEYDALNSKNVFTNGDTINGRIIVLASKDSPIRSLVLIAAGVARVCWTEGTEEGEINEQEIEYYGIKHCILEESRNAPAVIGQGRNVFPFSFKFPDRNIPTSFESPLGYVLHKLQLELKRRMRLTIRIATVLNFVCKPYVDITRLMGPLQDSTTKTFKSGSGHVRMDFSIPHRECKQGEVLRVTLNVANNSGRRVRPRLALCDQHTMTAWSKTNEVSRKLVKVCGKVVKPHRTESVTEVLNIPHDLTPSFLNCSIIRLQYWLKVYLDIQFANRLKMAIPIVLLPSLDAPTIERSPASAAAAAAAAAPEAFGSSIQTQWRTQQTMLLPEEPPPAYETL